LFLLFLKDNFLVLKPILLVIDSYLSTIERAYYCDKLITQIRTFFPEYKILLINKSKESFGVEKKVDYYFNFGDSFMVGYPPQETLENRAYSIPYVYFVTDVGTFENFMPLTGITDHVAGIYNSFILSSKISKSLGFEKVFKFEFDTVFNENELKKLKGEIESFDDYLMYGVRHEGQWTTHDLVDVHMIGFKNEVFDGLELVTKDEDYWNLCSKIGYYGKWIEYLIPAIINFQKNKFGFSGLCFKGNLRDYYSKTHFDTVNSPGGWTEKWKQIPMVARISIDSGLTELTDRVCIFYLNKDFDEVTVDVKIYSNEGLIYQKNKVFSHNNWLYEELEIKDDWMVISEYTTSSEEHKKMEYPIIKNDISKLTYRILKS